MLVVPPSTILVAWGNAWLTGHVGLDEAADAIERVGPHVLAGPLGLCDDGELPLRQALARLRVAGLCWLRLALPAPGDPLGLPGPVSLNAAAIEAGEAVLARFGERTYGLVPAEDRRGSSYVGVRWNVYDAGPGTPDVPSLAEADHQLTLAVRAATSTLTGIDDVAEWGPEVAETLTALRESHIRQPVGGLAPGYPPRAHRVAALAGRLAVVVDLAATHARTADSARGLTAAQMSRRQQALRELDRAVRRARVAACNSVLDPVG